MKLLIYWASRSIDRSRRLIGLSQSTYLDKVLKKFKMDQAKNGFLPVLQGVKLSQTQCPATTEDREKMSVIPYAFEAQDQMSALP